MTAGLDEIGVRYLASEAGFFVFCDMRSFMSEVSWEAEGELWRMLLDEANVTLTPGSACRVGEPGFMRLCFAGEPTEAVLIGIERMGRVLDSISV